MLSKSISIDDIKLGDRHRKDFGDIEGLAASIKSHGLLQPIGVTKDNVLIFGQRRLMACKSIGWKQIPCSVLDIDRIVDGEHAENEIRKDFTHSEREAIRRAIEATISRRQGARADIVSTCGQSPTSSTAPDRGEKTREFSAKKAGFPSETTARRVRHVVENGSPELVKALDSGEVSPDRAAKIAAMPHETQRKILAGELSLSTGTKNEKKKQPPKRPEGPLPRTTSAKAAYIREWIGNGERADTACASCGMSKGEYQRAVTVVEYGNKDLIDAMDSELLSVNAAREAVKTPEKIESIIDAARLKDVQKNHKQMSIKGKSKQQILFELLSGTYGDWKGAENNLAINSQIIPSDQQKLSELVRLCKVVRKTVNFVLDNVEREIAKCSAKTTERKTC